MEKTLLGLKLESIVVINYNIRKYNMKLLNWIKKLFNKQDNNEDHIIRYFDLEFKDGHIERFIPSKHGSLELTLTMESNIKAVHCIDNLYDNITNKDK